MEISLTQPDDWHLHLRDSHILKAVISHSARVYGRAIVMPNLKPAIKTTAAALTYAQKITKEIPENSNFTPLMTLYLTDHTSREEIKLARISLHKVEYIDNCEKHMIICEEGACIFEEGISTHGEEKSGKIYGVKLYPAGATTNSQDGVTDLFGNCMPVLKEMTEQNMPLLVHGEVTDSNVDIFDRERVFIETILKPLTQKLPKLKIVMEHVTTSHAVDFVLSSSTGMVAATVTPQHLFMNRNALFEGGLQPHNFCLPVLKREKHRRAVLTAVTGRSRRFFLGTDSAPHYKLDKETPCGCAGVFNAPVALSLYATIFEQEGALDKLEAFTSFNGPDFYGIPRNTAKILIRKSSWKVPALIPCEPGGIVPFLAGRTLHWEVLPKA